MKQSLPGALVVLHILASMACSAESKSSLPISESLIAGGSYYFGSVFGDQDYRSHANATVHDYYVMRNLVTFRLYARVSEWAATHGYELEIGVNGWRRNSPLPDDTDSGEHPVTGISWLGAAVWANALSEMQGLRPVYRDAKGSVVRRIQSGDQLDAARVRPADNGYRLPDMREWQIAARGGQSGLAAGSYGSPHAGSNVSAHRASRFRPVGGTTRIALFRPNAAGLYDMSGNVSQWTASVFEMPDANPIPGERYFYYCGESWTNYQDEDLSFCDMHSAGFGSHDIGFRLVRNRI